MANFDITTNFCAYNRAQFYITNNLTIGLNVRVWYNIQYYAYDGQGTPEYTNTGSSSYTVASNSGNTTFSIYWSETLPKKTSGYYYINLSATGTNASTGTSQSASATRYFYPYRTLNVSAPDGHGSPVFSSNGSTNITGACGTDYAITWNPSSGYELDYWCPADTGTHYTSGGLTATYAYDNFSAGWNGTDGLTCRSKTNVTALTPRKAYVYYKVAPVTTYTVAFNGNGNTGGSMSNQTITVGQATPLSTNGFTKTGYSFAGWATSSTGAVAYSNGQSVTNLASAGGTITLYAKWTANTYSVSLNNNGGSGGTTSINATYDSALPNITVPSRTGYTFNGYYIGSTKYYNANGTSARNWDIASNGNVLWASWTPNTFTYTYWNDGSNVGSSTFTYDSTATLKTASALGISKSGYTFAGWSTADLGVTRDYSDGATVTNTLTSGNRNVFAVWQRTATFYSGINCATVKTSTEYYNNGASSLSIPAAPTTIGSWTALGWRYDGSATTATVTTTGNISNIYGKTWYAVYSRTITLAYSNNGGSGTTANQTVTQYYNSSNNITEPSFTLKASNIFTRTGYTFSNWGTSSSGGTQYDAGDTYKPSATVGSTTTTFTMYAIWSANTYTVSFNANGGTPTPSSISGAFDSNITLPSAISKSSIYSSGFTITYNLNGHGSTVPSSETMTDRTDYTFSKWAKGSVSSTEKYNADGSYKIADANNNVVFYATWTPTLVYGSTTLPTLPNDGSWIFSGWSTSSSATSGATGAYTPSSNVTLYAVWVGDYATVTFNGNGGYFEIAEGLGGVTNQTISVLKGDYITLPSSGWKVGTVSRLLGWSSNNVSTKKGTAIQINNNVTFTAVWYDFFYWVSQSLDDTQIAPNKPVTNATSLKWYSQVQSLQKNIQKYVDSSFIPAASSSGSIMVGSEFKRVADALNVTLKTYEQGAVIYAEDFIAVRDALNTQADLII